ncbi:MAG: KUP/HAK/KT family potassium transporter, partial [Planctomycetota bacterium]
MSAEADAPETREPPRGRRLAALSVAALGVVYGDIGTSPLYAIRECFHGDYGVGLTHANVLGILSLVLWSLLIVVSVKYLSFILRADNQGEGGVIALMALLRAGHGSRPGRRTLVLVALGLFGASLLYGDGMITPAISVLSAVEGLEVTTPALGPWVIPITILILVALFLVQHRGTAKVGSIFGPVTIVWFATLAVLGVGGFVRAPQVRLAV